MPFTDSDLRALKPQAKQFRVAARNGLFVAVYPNGGKYLVWKHCFPLGRGGKQRWHHCGVYGRCSEQWTLKAARDEKNRLDLQRRRQDPMAVKADAQRALEKQAAVLNLRGIIQIGGIVNFRQLVTRSIASKFLSLNIFFVRKFLYLWIFDSFCFDAAVASA